VTAGWKRELDKTLGKKRYRAICLQLPEGMKRRAHIIADYISDKTGGQVIVSGDPCYGACDLATDIGEPGGKMEVDVIVHFGHSKIGEGNGKENIHKKLPVIYVECRSGLKPSHHLLSRLMSKMNKGETMALATTVQHVNALPEIRKSLEESGFKVLIGKPGKRARYPGQVLGCDIGGARALSESADRFIFVGSGDFHPIGIAMATGRDVLICDLEKNEIREIAGGLDRFLRKRHALIQKAKEGKMLGILVSTKSGQKRMALASRLFRLAEKCRMKAYIIAMREVTPQTLLNFGMDAYVSTACPRIAIDDAAGYSKPVITPAELEIALGKRKWEDYVLDSFS